MCPFIARIPGKEVSFMKKKNLPATAVLWALTAALILSFFISLALGRYAIGLREALGILYTQAAQSFGLPPMTPFWTATQASLLYYHRLPRILLACLVGCCLSAAGAAYQGVFQNPMAAPDLLGASSGAAFGAALAIYLGGGRFGIVLFAFVGSLLTVFLVMLVATRARGKRVTGLILAGIMVGSLVSSGTSFIKLVADPGDQLPAITYWLMGSLNGSSPQDAVLAAIPMAMGLIPLLLVRWRINVLTLGDEEARTMGVDARKLRALAIFCATLTTAASVAVSGVIGWVGLVVPNLVRRLVGNDYRVLLPASMLFGAVFLLWVDNLSRNLLQTEIPIGILTALIGAPFFIALMGKDGEQL